MACMLNFLDMFGTQYKAVLTNNINCPFTLGKCKFIFLSIVFYQTVLLQRGQAETLWPRDTYGEYERSSF